MFPPLLVSEQVPNVGSHLLAAGLVTRDDDELPRVVDGWKVGESYVYPIEFLTPALFSTTHYCSCR